MAAGIRPFAARPTWTGVASNGGSTVQEPDVSSSPSDVAAYQSTMLKSINELLTQLRDLSASRRPEGRVAVYKYTLTPGDTKTANLSPACFSVNILSQGPGSCQYRIPDGGDWIDIVNNSPDTYNADYPVFTSIGVKNSGSSANVVVIIRALY